MERDENGETQAVRMRIKAERVEEDKGRAGGGKEATSVRHVE
jgi:hypothetical protein